ncbi:MAG TPA: ABC transporter permease [Xanthomonadaceae bacterium]|nr:ABC transporter permease [Xanthomonadaceae bacterium]
MPAAEASHWRRWLALTWLFARQDLGARLRDNLIGSAWLLLSPLLQLAVFYFIFLHVFRARVPGLEGTGYLAFLALAFWPWFAFSEAVARSTSALPDHAALIGKVALPRSALVASRTLAAFALHGVGFVFVLALLPAFGIALTWQGLPPAIALWLVLLLLAFGLGLLTAATQVFVRDTGTIVGHLLQALFFLTPILYSREMVPELMRAVLDANPLTGLVGGIRGLLLGSPPATEAWVASLVATAVILAAGIFVFRRCDRHFEDYL